MGRQASRGGLGVRGIIRRSSVGREADRPVGTDCRLPGIPRRGSGWHRGIAKEWECEYASRAGTRRDGVGHNQLGPQGTVHQRPRLPGVLLSGGIGGKTLAPGEGKALRGTGRPAAQGFLTRRFTAPTQNCFPGGSAPTASGTITGPPEFSACPSPTAWCRARRAKNCSTASTPRSARRGSSGSTLDCPAC